MKHNKIFLRITGFQENCFGTEIVEEAHRANYEEVYEFIKTHLHENTTWIIKPVDFTT